MAVNETALTYRRAPWAARALAATMGACAVVLAANGVWQVWSLVNAPVGAAPVGVQQWVAGAFPVLAALLVLWSAAALLWRRPGAGPAALLQLMVVALAAALVGSVMLLVLALLGIAVCWLGRVLAWSR